MSYLMLQPDNKHEWQNVIYNYMHILIEINMSYLMLQPDNKHEWQIVICNYMYIKKEIYELSDAAAWQ